MKIKQQKQIRIYYLSLTCRMSFLEAEFESSKSSALFDVQERTLQTLIENTKDKSKTR